MLELKKFWVFVFCLVKTKPLPTVGGLFPNSRVLVLYYPVFKLIWGPAWNAVGALRFDWLIE